MTQWGLDTLFNPAKRHMDDEKRRLQSTREELGDSSGGKRIDLESGKVRIQRDESTETTGSDGTGAHDDAGPKPSKNGKRNGKPTTEPSAAAIRAAQRRGRSLPS